jgi:hypothetical protein
MHSDTMVKPAMDFLLPVNIVIAHPKGDFRQGSTVQGPMNSSNLCGRKL